MPSPGMTAIRYFFFSALIERFLVPCRAGSAGHLIGLQWTKLHHGATLHCNVDGFCGSSLTVKLTDDTQPDVSQIKKASHGSPFARQTRPDHWRVQRHWR